MTQMLEVLTQGDDASLAASALTFQQAVANLHELLTLVRARSPEDEERLKTLHLHYMASGAPNPGEYATLAYRLRMLTLDRWGLWRRLMCYRTWRWPCGKRVDGTNSACERAIGWLIEGLRQAVHGTRRVQSTVRTNCLFALCAIGVAAGGVHLAQSVALESS